MPVRFAHVGRDLARLFGVNLVTRALGIGALVVYARLLPPVELAALPVFFLLGSFVTVPCNFGFFPTLMREVPLFLESDRPAALAQIRTVVLVVGGGILAIALGYVVLAPGIAQLFFGTPAWTWLILWMVPGTVARGLDDITTFILRSTGEFRHLAQKKLVAEVTTPIAAIGLIFPFGVRGLIAGVTLGVIAGLVWAIYCVRHYVFQSCTAAPVAPLLRRSKPYYVESLLFFLTQQGDQALVGALLSPVALSSYYVARRIPDAMALMLLSVEEVMGPTLARTKAGAPADRNQMFAGFAITVAAFVVPIAALTACLAPAYTRLVGAQSYGGVTPAVAILSLGLIAQGAMTLVSQSALALGHPADRLKVTVTFASLLLAFTAGTAGLGLTAVAVGRVTAIVVATLVGARLLQHVLPAVPWQRVAKLLVPTALLVATLFALQVLSDNLWFVPAYGAAAVGVFAIAVWVGLDPMDRRRLVELWRGRGAAGEHDEPRQLLDPPPGEPGQ
ncbi:MAG TPA: oligosaccharide flippase family protein [Gemmatimonadales bacterium]|nr:oligosaccharide flippase family protein [Gemmatimonadales bacterium]